MSTILINTTFTESNPESAEDGEYSDQGFIAEDCAYTFRELVEELKRDNYNREGADWAYTHPEIADYETMTEHSTQIHVSRSNANYQRARRYFDKACKAAGLKF
jgi:hypothetical protein